MRKIDEQELSGYLIGREEGRNLEFKPPFMWCAEESKKIKEETIKAVIAMSNTFGGGAIIIGIEVNKKSTKEKYSIVGINDKVFDWFNKNYEEIEKDIHRYCSITPEFEITWGEIECGDPWKMRKFILINVDEFSIMPIMCIANGKTREDSGIKDFLLKQDTIYSRTYKAQWSSRKCGVKELEEIIQLAADKYKQDLKIRGYVKLDSLVVKLKEERSDYE
ncbi:MAG: putative DNA binding domain-containing protein [Patescibacteria group bacterium]|nr:putative DNA binding domain-containing protein [Patescibacteria group bacterium]